MGHIKTGFYPDIPNETYHHGEGWKEHLSKSGISKFIECPAKLKHSKENPSEPTAAMKFGSAYHTYVLENNLFSSEYAIMPEGINRRTKIGKAEYETFCNQNKNKEIITAEDLVIIKAMGKVVLQSETACALLEGSIIEESIAWNDPEFDFPCKCRPDFRGAGLKLLGDLKTTKSIETFPKDAANFGYDMQAAFYLNGINAVQDSHYTTFVFIVQEKTAPYALKVFKADQEFVDNGRKKINAMREYYSECYNNNHWPMAEDKVHDLSLPAWAIK